MNKISLGDIAKRLGVSKSLVSSVLNGKSKENRISEEMTQKVIEVAKELNYQPNLLAKALRTGKSGTLGLIVADISNPFFGKFGREVEDEAAKHGYRVIFCSSDEKLEKFSAQVNMLKSADVDGLIITPPIGSEQELIDLQKSKLPFVLVDRYFHEINCDYVIIDNFQASYNAVKYLLSKGFKKIALLNVNSELQTMHDRFHGYSTALEEGGLFDKNLVKELAFSHDKDEVGKAIDELVNYEVDILFFSSNKVGQMGIECLMEKKIKVPEDIGIISFDDPEYYKICYSPVTAIAQPIAEMSKAAVKIIIDNISNGNLSSSKVILPTELIVRNSSTKHQ